MKTPIVTLGLSLFLALPVAYGSAPDDEGGTTPCDADGRFDPPSMEKRFESGPGNETTGARNGHSARESFRQRMLDRIGGYH